MPRGVSIALPSYDGTVRIETAMALTQSVSALQSRRYNVGVRTQVNCSILPLMRNQLVADFLRHEQFDDLVFIDHDIEFKPEDLLKLLDAPVDFIGGIYPKRIDPISFPFREVEGAFVGREHPGLLEVEGVPAGFLRLTRRCLQAMVDRYYSLVYEDSRIDTGKSWDLFGNLKMNGQYWGEDYSFCHRWREMGGRIYTDPSLAFTHWGTKGYSGKLADIMVMPDGTPAVSNVTPISAVG